MLKPSFVRIAKCLLLPACMVTACTDAEVFSPSGDNGTLLPRFTLQSGDTEITIWHEGQSYTFNAVNRQLRSGGRSVYLDDELTAKVRTAFQSILEGDVLSQALESAAGDGPGEIVEPYRLGRNLPDQQGRRVQVFESGEFSTGGKIIVRIIPAGRLTGADNLDGVSMLSTDACGDIAGTILGTRTSFGETRSAFLGTVAQALFDAATGAILNAAQGIGEAVSRSGADVAYAHINMGILGTLWNSYGCKNKTIQATGFVMVSGFGGSIATDSDGITTLFCYFVPEWVEIAGKLYPVDLRVCSFKQQWN